MSDFCSIFGSYAGYCRSLFYSGSSQGTSGCGWGYGKALDEPKDAGVADLRPDTPQDKGPDKATDFKPDAPKDFKADLPKDFSHEMPVDFKIDVPKDVGGEGLDITPTDVGTDIKTDTTPTWTYCYNGNVYPENDGWTETAPAGWTTKSISSGILELSSIGKNQAGNYKKTIATLKGTGWVFETRMQLVDNESEGGVMIQIQDGTHYIEFVIANTRIYENMTSKSYNMDPRIAFNTYRIVKNGSNYDILVNGVSQITGTAVVSSGTSSILWHDPSGTLDGHAKWDYLCYYTGP